MRQAKRTNKNALWQRLVYWHRSNKKKSILLATLVLLVVLVAVPWSRYQLAKLVLKQNFSVQVVDSVTNTPVSAAYVSAGSMHVITNGDGKAVLNHMKVGNNKVTVIKKYYKGNSASILVPILKQKTVSNIKLQATGHRVKVTVRNLITHASLANVAIYIADVNAKTDKSGSATVAVPPDAASFPAVLSLAGYNSPDVNVKVNYQTIAENDFNLTPAGQIYFLSNSSGALDVVKANLDGSNRQTVLAGTGNETDQDTVLLASHDWKYLALFSNRDGIIKLKDD